MQSYTRADLVNLHKPIHNELVYLSEEIVLEVLNKASYFPENNRYIKSNWDNLRLNNYMMDKLIILLKETFPDSNIYFASRSNGPKLIVDWS
jgi:hypothetical protein